MKMHRRRLVASLVLVLVAAAGLGLYLVRDRGGRASDAARPSYSLDTVKRQTLTVSTSSNGKLGYASTAPLHFRASGTVTWLPPSGSTVTQGQLLLRIDNKPVVLMYGTTPAYRTIAASESTGEADDRQAGHQKQDNSRPRNGNRGSSASDPPSPPPAPTTGPDVEELEANLAALGYSGFTVDDEFTEYTEAAVKAWQEDLGVPATGRVELGSVIFASGPIRVTTDRSALGSTDPSLAIKATSLDKVVTTSAPVDEAGWAKTGVHVQVTLPNQRTVAGSVTQVGAPKADGGEGGPSVPIQIKLKKPTQQSGDVTVTHISRRAKHALVVPVTALVALAEGGYALQRQDGSYTAVKPGLYADGKVQITGKIQAGTKVRDAP